MKELSTFILLITKYLQMWKDLEGKCFFPLLNIHLSFLEVCIMLCLDWRKWRALRGWIFLNLDRKWGKGIGWMTSLPFVRNKFLPTLERFGRKTHHSSFPFPSSSLPFLPLSLSKRTLKKVASAQFHGQRCSLCPLSSYLR